MNEAFHKLSDLAIDAVPQNSKLYFKENLINPNFNIEKLVDSFCVEDYKSIFFLLMDYDVGPKNFTSLTNQDLTYLKSKLINIFQKYFREETIFIELFFTLKMYKKLKLFNTCFHVHESQSNLLKHIEKIWKVLFKLCEEITDENLKVLKQKVPEGSRNHIQSAEDWFCWALNENIFSRTDLSSLETTFKEYPDCLKIIRNFKDFELYPIKVSSSSSSCGMAVLLNYDKFNENSKLEPRKNSEKDVDALKKLWKDFGFEVKYHLNLNSSETYKVFQDIALDDHSNFDAFVCCILSHGIRSNVVYASDGKLMEITDFIRPIMNQCTSLNGKPKLFFIQACAGEYIQQGAGKQTYRMNIDEMPAANLNQRPPPPLKFDTLISSSSIDGYVSFRNNQGSWFFQTFCKIMMKYGDTYTMEEVLTKVNDEISKFSVNLEPFGPNKALQMPEYSSNLRKKLILKKRLG